MPRTVVTGAAYGNEPKPPPQGAWVLLERWQSLWPAPKGYVCPHTGHSGPVLFRVECARWAPA